MKAFLSLQECSNAFRTAYIHGGVVAALAFLAGAAGLSALTLLFLLAFLLLALGTLYGELQRKEEMKEALDDRKASMESIPRDGETTEWLSHTLVRVWTAYRMRMESRLAGQLQEFLDFNKPSWVDSFSNQELQLGELAPHIHHIWVMTPQRSSNLEMDLLVDITILLPDLQWNMTATLHPVKVNVPLQVRDLLLRGKMMFKLRYQAEKPYVEKMWLSFAGQPDFRFSTKVLKLVQMNDVPVLRTFLDNLIRDSLKDNMVHPQRWLIDINRIWHGEDADPSNLITEPVVIIVAHIPAAQGSLHDINIAAWSSFGLRPSASSEGEVSSCDDSCDEDNTSRSFTGNSNQLIHSVCRQNMTLTIWLKSNENRECRTLLMNHFNDEVEVVLRGVSNTGASSWSTSKVVDAKDLLAGDCRIPFLVKGRKLSAEVKVYQLQAAVSAGAVFDGPLPTTMGAMGSLPPGSTTEPPVQLGSEASVGKPATYGSSLDPDSWSLKKKLDDKMANRVGNTLRSLVRSKEATKTTPLGTFISRASQILNSISIPAKVFNSARGIALMSVYKVGLVLGVRSGAGILVVRDEDGWSAPSALWLGGMSAGLEGGAQSVDIALILNGDEGMEAFCSSVVVLGSDVTLLPGPVADEEVESCQSAPIFCYTHNKGNFRGLSLRGTVITEHRVLNRRFYGRNFRTTEILQSKSLRDLQDVQTLHAVLQDADCITGADEKHAPRKFLDDIARPDTMGAMGGLVRFTIVTVTDVNLPESARLYCLVHRDARLVGRCSLDRQGAGEWAISTAAAANISMVVYNTACCILQLTVVSDIDGTHRVVGSTAMDVYTCLNSVEGQDSRLVLQLGPSMASEDMFLSRRAGDWEDGHGPGQDIGCDGVSLSSSLESANATLPRNTFEGCQNADEDSAGLSDSDSAGGPAKASVSSHAISPLDSLVQKEKDRDPEIHRTAASTASITTAIRVTKAMDVELCANHSAHTAEWLYGFVHQGKLARDFKHHLRTVPNCFMAREVVEQLVMCGHYTDRPSAISFMQSLMPSQSGEGVIHPINSELSVFEDKKVFYRFFADEMTGIGKGAKEKYNIPGFSHDESASVHWQKWVSRREGEEAGEGKSDKLIWRSIEAAKEIIKRNRKKEDGIMIPQVQCTITFRPAENLATDLGEQGAVSDDFSPHIEKEPNDPLLQRPASPKNVPSSSNTKQPYASHSHKRLSSPSSGLPFEVKLPTSSLHPSNPLVESSVQAAQNTQDQVLCLTVVIKQGRNLKAKGGMCDAYVKVRLENEKVHRTKTMKKSASPVWDEEFKIKMISRLNGTIDFQVKDWNPISDDTLLASATLYLDAYFGQQEVKGLVSKTVHLALSSPSKKPYQGQLTLRLTAQPGIR